MKHGLKLFIALCLITALAAAAAGCSGGKKEETAPVKATEAESLTEDKKADEPAADAGEKDGTAAAEKAGSKEAGENAGSKDNGEKAGAQEKPADGKSEEGQKEDGGEAFAELLKDVPEGTVFGFFSGAGAWETMLQIGKDGTFTGEFYDANMGENGENEMGAYMGTLYSCPFDGKFSNPVKKDDYTYQFTVEELNTLEAFENGKSQYIDEDQTLHILTMPYGISAKADMEAYLPGKPLDELDKDCREWLGLEWMYQDIGDKLPKIVIYNLTEKTPFVVDEYASMTVEDADGGPVFNKEKVQVTRDENGINGKGTYGYHFNQVDERDGKVDYWGIDLYDGNGDSFGYQIEVAIRPDSLVIPDPEDLLYEMDVNYDGLMDITACQGVFGEHEITYERAYIRSGEAFEELIGYNEIPNPTPSPLDGKIYGTVRDAEDHYIEYCYEIQGDKVVKTGEIPYQYDEDAKDYVAVN